MPLVARVALVAFVLALAPRGDAAQLYHWVDGEGRLHVTDDPSQVPPQHRVRSPEPDDEGAGGQADPGPSAPATPPAAIAPGPAAPSAALTVPAAPRRHLIPVARAGLELGVQALLDGRLQVAFKVDTGATLNTIPRRVALELGLDVSDAAPSTVVAGIDGQPRLVPIVTVRQVQLGTAVVEDVEMAVLDTLEYGLLGMPFFNNFRVSTDPAAGVLALEEIDLAGIEGIYGGYDESYWRSRFAMVRHQIEQIDAMRRAIPGEYGWLHERAQASADYWQNQYELLDLKATRAGVPTAWRE
jgi:clan AA aspartic protease (TIGR02281 family)